MSRPREDKWQSAFFDKRVVFVPIDQPLPRSENAYRYGGDRQDRPRPVPIPASSQEVNDLERAIAEGRAEFVPARKYYQGKPDSGAAAPPPSGEPRLQGILKKDHVPRQRSSTDYKRGVQILDHCARCDPRGEPVLGDDPDDRSKPPPRDCPECGQKLISVATIEHFAQKRKELIPYQEYNVDYEALMLGYQDKIQREIAEGKRIAPIKAQRVVHLDLGVDILKQPKNFYSADVFYRGAENGSVADPDEDRTEELEARFKIEQRVYLYAPDDSDDSDDA